MEMISWTSVDDLRANLRAEERARFDAQLRELASHADATDADYTELVHRWRLVTHRADLPAERYRFVDRPTWKSRLTASFH